MCSVVTVSSFVVVFFFIETLDFCSCLRKPGRLRSVKKDCVPARGGGVLVWMIPSTGERDVARHVIPRQGIYE